MHKEQLALVFLVFIIVIISSMVYRVPAKAACVTLLVGVLGTFLIPEARRQHTVTPCHHDKPTEEETTLYKSKQMAKAIDEEPEPTYSNLHESENQYSEQDFDVMLYNNLDAVKDVYDDMACPGDNALASRMLEQGKRSQQATIARAKFDKYSMLHYFDEELRSAEGSRWWDNDALEHKF